MFNESPEEQQRNSAFRKIDGHNNNSSNADLNNVGLASEMMQVINAQNTLIMKLVQRQNLLYKELNKRFSSSNSSSGSQNKDTKASKIQGFRELNQQIAKRMNSSADRDLSVGKNSVKIIQREMHLVTQNKDLNNNVFRDESSSSIFEDQPSSEQPVVKATQKKRQTQTKNMVKNFAKAIFRYILKNKDKRKRVLSYLGIHEEEFMIVFEQLKGKVHSISELRSLWTPQGNIFHKAFRILSNDYLRKSCINRTFNSRVQNYQIHLKYRQRLLQGLRTPQQFTNLKTT